MGLLGCPASFQRLMETVLGNISNVLVYIDDVLLHTATQEHLQVLDKVFERLHQNHLKVNLDKCVFGNREVSYLSFMLTPEGIKPGRKQTTGYSRRATSYQHKNGQIFCGTLQLLWHSHQGFCNNCGTSVQGHQKGLKIQIWPSTS
jgi:hypothetical protein